MNPTTEQKSTVSEAVRKHKKFLFHAVAYSAYSKVMMGSGDNGLLF